MLLANSGAAVRRARRAGLRAQRPSKQPGGGDGPSGRVIAASRVSYTPYGEEVGGGSPTSWDNDAGFTGHVKDQASGLTYMQARYYDPVVGRFLSNDPVAFAAGQPMQFNRYGYGHGDPINKIDPDGEFPQLFSGAIGGAIGGAVGGISSFASSGRDLNATLAGAAGGLYLVRLSVLLDR